MLQTDEDLRRVQANRFERIPLLLEGYSICEIVECFSMALSYRPHGNTEIEVFDHIGSYKAAWNGSGSMESKIGHDSKLRVYI